MLRKRERGLGPALGQKQGWRRIMGERPREPNEGGTPAAQPLHLRRPRHVDAPARMSVVPWEAYDVRRAFDVPTSTRGHMERVISRLLCREDEPGSHGAPSSGKPVTWRDPCPSLSPCRCLAASVHSSLLLDGVVRAVPTPVPVVLLHLRTQPYFLTA